MKRHRPELMMAAWLGGCFLLAGCQSVPAPTPGSTAPADFFPAKSPAGASHIRLAGATEALKIEDRGSKIEDRGSTVKDGEVQKVGGAPFPFPHPPSSVAACSAPGFYGPDGDVPRELSKVFLPAYIIEPPDILLVEAVPSLPDQPVQGEHLVRPDGTISLGTYGSVHVAGLTLDQARVAIKVRLSEYIKNVKINLDVFAYNSKVVYIIADGAGFGQQVFRLPFTGNETVLDAIGQIGGLPIVASKKKIWVARPGEDDSIQTLPVDWKAITQDGLARTNYQLFPGDRIYIEADRLIALDGIITKIVTPMERVFGVTYLGARTIFQLQNMGRGALAGGGF